jgi:hypothetical protein
MNNSEEKYIKSKIAALMFEKFASNIIGPSTQTSSGPDKKKSDYYRDGFSDAINAAILFVRDLMDIKLVDTAESNQVLGQKLIPIDIDFYCKNILGDKLERPYARPLPRSRFSVKVPENSQIQDLFRPGDILCMPYEFTAQRFQIVSIERIRINEMPPEFCVQEGINILNNFIPEIAEIFSKLGNRPVRTMTGEQIGFMLRWVRQNKDGIQDLINDSEIWSVEFKKIEIENHYDVI